MKGDLLTIQVEERRLNLREHNGAQFQNTELFFTNVLSGDEVSRAAVDLRRLLGLVAAADHHVRTGREEGLADAAPHPTAATGDEHRATREIDRITHSESSLAMRSRWWAGSPSSTSDAWARLK